MQVVKSYFHGIKRAAREGRMLFLLWFFNVCFAAVVYFQISGWLRKAFGTSAAAEDFLKDVDFNAFFEMLAFEGSGLGAVVSLALVLSIVYGFFTIFLKGGILQTLHVGRGLSGESRRLAPLFFQGAGKFFGRFFRLFLYSLLLWTGAAAVMVIIGILISPIFNAGTNEAMMFHAGLAAAIFGLVLAFLILMIVDYARIRIVIENSSAVFKSLLWAIGFVSRRLGKTLALYYLYLLTGAIVIAAYWAVTSRIETHSLLPILVAFLIGQIFMIGRTWLKVGIQAAQMNFAAEFALTSEEKPGEPDVIEATSDIGSET